MSSSLEFTFNQEELAAMAAVKGVTTVVFSVCNLPEEDGQSELYLCAEAYKDNKAIAGATMAVGCPNPPGWQKVIANEVLERSSLVFSPKYAVGVAQLKKAVARNTFIDEDKIRKLVTVLEGRIQKMPSREGRKKVDTLVTILAFKNSTVNKPPFPAKSTAPGDEIVAVPF